MLVVIPDWLRIKEQCSESSKESRFCKTGRYNGSCVVSPPARPPGNTSSTRREVYFSTSSRYLIIDAPRWDVLTPLVVPAFWSPSLLAPKQQSNWHVTQPTVTLSLQEITTWSRSLWATKWSPIVTGTRPAGRSTSRDCSTISGYCTLSSFPCFQNECLVVQSWKTSANCLQKSLSCRAWRDVWWIEWTNWCRNTQDLFTTNANSAIIAGVNSSVSSVGHANGLEVSLTQRTECIRP